MTEFEGKFTNINNENLDEYYAAIGIPWVARKMMTATSPTIEVAKTEYEIWTIKISSLVSTTSNTFKLGEEYEETMPGSGRVIKNVTIIEKNQIITTSVSDRGKSKRVLEYSDDGFIMILTHEQTDIIAKRYFKRA